MNKWLTLCIFVFAWQFQAHAEYFIIKNYQVDVKVQQDASLDITEIIDVTFSEPRHGIYRNIPFRFKVQPLTAGEEKANRSASSDGYTYTWIRQISVENHAFETGSSDDYKVIKIGSANAYVEGDVRYIIHYKVLNAINFFDKHAELYFNLIGNLWETTIEHVAFNIEFYKPLPKIGQYFTATGAFGSTENATAIRWKNNNQVFTGETTRVLNPGEGLTVGIEIPQGFLEQQNYTGWGSWILGLPLLLLGILYSVWNKWGRDDDASIVVRYRPTDKLSPTEAGVIIDEKLDNRDLLALIPFWGHQGFIKLRQIKNTTLLGLFSNTDYEFTKLAELPSNVPAFEKTMFDGIFSSGNVTLLSSLKNKFYLTLGYARNQVESHIKEKSFFIPGTRGFGIFLMVLAAPAAFGGITLLLMGIFGQVLYVHWIGITLIISAVMLLVFGWIMPKKGPLGVQAYQEASGLKLFIKDAELPKIEAFLKEDPNYFDKMLPYAVAFNLADKWAAHFKDLTLPAPTWYVGPTPYFNAGVFSHEFENAMSQISSTMSSAPSSSGTSGGSFSGGGFSGGGFGGGGGGSW